MPDIEIKNVQSTGEIKIVKELFEEYAKSLNFSLCFQNFDKELKNLPGDYSPPKGSLLLSEYNGIPAGCVGLRKFENDICEMKRLYVKNNFRGLKIGRMLVYKIIDEAKRIGYKKMRLDTIQTMQAAQNLYKSLGFYEISSYGNHPIEGTIYMELNLDT